MARANLLLQLVLLVGMSFAVMPLKGQIFFGSGLALKANIEARLFSSAQELELVAQISVPAGSHIYSVRKQEGIMPTSLEAESNTQLEALDATKESEPIMLFDEALQKKLWAHKNLFELRRSFALPKSPIIGAGQFYLSYQICNQQVCSLPVKTAFSAEMTAR